MNLLLYGVVALAILGTLAGIGYKVRQSGYDACKVEWAQASAEQAKREQEASAKASKALEEKRVETKVVIQKRTVYVDKLVDRPVYRNVCLDADGLRCLNAAIDGKDATGCKPDSAVPAPKPAG